MIITIFIRANCSPPKGSYEEKMLHSVKCLALNFNQSFPIDTIPAKDSPKRHHSLMLSPYKNRSGNNECEKYGFQEVQRIWKDYEIVMAENESLKENKKDLSFLKLSSSIENQLLKHQLKEARGKLSFSENELEEAKIDSERKSIFMLEMFENSYCDDAAVMQAEKVRLELELEKSKSEIEELRLESETNSVEMLELLHHDKLIAMRLEKEALENELQNSKNEIMTLGLKFNDHVAMTTEEKRKKQAELLWRNEECVSLTADCLNFQAATECLNTSTEMTDFRNQMLRKSHVKQIEQMQEMEKLTKARLLSFIMDFDSSASKSCDPDSLIESFLDGRGLAINRKKRKHIAHLKLENAELHENLDTLNELMICETALAATQKELYTKEVETRIDTYTKAVESSTQSLSISSNPTISTSCSTLSPPKISTDNSSKISPINSGPLKKLEELNRVSTADERTRDPKIIDSGSKDESAKRRTSGGFSIKVKKEVKDINQQSKKVGAFNISEDGKENKVQEKRSENTPSPKGSVNSIHSKPLRLSTGSPKAAIIESPEGVSDELAEMEMLKLRNLEASLKDDIEKSPGYYAKISKVNLTSSTIPSVLSLTPRTRRLSTPLFNKDTPSPSSGVYKSPLFPAKTPLGNSGKYSGAVKTPLGQKKSPATDAT
jgi:hypothetical protein